MLYITADNSSTNCKGSTLAHAGPCAQDQYGRPVAGGINICEAFFDGTAEWKLDTESLLHEMTHITVMLSDLWQHFRDSNGDIMRIDEVYDGNVDPPVLKSPILLEMVRDHFNCSTVNGLPLDPYSSHWHERFVFSENMNPTVYSQQMYYSKFTLALMVCNLEQK